MRSRSARAISNSASAVFRSVRTASSSERRLSRADFADEADRPRFAGAQPSSRARAATARCALRSAPPSPRAAAPRGVVVGQARRHRLRRHARTRRLDLRVAFGFAIDLRLRDHLRLRYQPQLGLWLELELEELAARGRLLRHGGYRITSSARSAAHVFELEGLAVDAARRRRDPARDLARLVHRPPSATRCTRCRSATAATRASCARTPRPRSGRRRCRRSARRRCPGWRWKRRLGRRKPLGRDAGALERAVPLVDGALAILDVVVAQHLVHRGAQRNVLVDELAVSRRRPCGSGRRAPCGPRTVSSL